MSERTTAKRDLDAAERDAVDEAGTKAGERIRPSFATRSKETLRDQVQGDIEQALRSQTAPA